ncbi:GH3 auxin-responsive promoter family protein [Nocardia sp. NPDC005978]|uniref:GH3 family domain-containing protein n=1 Tax=unclassified Nocardia TaxID=2637762 RepID=UPI0033AF829F
MTSTDIEQRVDSIRRLAVASRETITAALAEPERVQAQFLDRLIRRNEGTDFGREHGFADITDVADYRRAVPIRVHEDFAPWIESVIGGAHNVLDAEDPFAFFSSSGTTGTEKRVPATMTYMREGLMPFYFAGLSTILGQNADMLAGDNAVLNLWQDPFSNIRRTSGGQPHIGPSQVDFSALGEEAAVGLGNRAAWSQLPESFRDADALRRMYLRLRIAAQYDVRCVIAMNPGIAHALPEQLRRWWPAIVKDLYDGTLDGVPFTDPDPETARRIEAHARWFGTVRPIDLWPRLGGVVTWTTYVAGLYLPAVAREYGPGVKIMTAPVGSCEGPLVVPLDRHPDAGPLAVPWCFYEFIPVEQEIEPDSPTLLAHELEADRTYHVVLTRAGGIYRCATRDLVYVAGHIGRTPRVAYAGRHGTLTVSGTPLREDQALRALRATAHESGLEVRNLVWKLDARQGVPHHHAAVAFTAAESPSAVTAFEELADRRLCADVAAYAIARERGDLGPLRVSQVSLTSFFDVWFDQVRAAPTPSRVKDRVFDDRSPVWNEVAP